jgi:hypothetical protein
VPHLKVVHTYNLIRLACCSICSHNLPYDADWLLGIIGYAESRRKRIRLLLLLQLRLLSEELP